MLKIIIPTAFLIPSAFLLNSNILFSTMLVYSMLLALLSLSLFNHPMLLKISNTTVYFNTDMTSAPLIILSCWLLPLMILASQNHLKTEPLNRKRTFLMILTTLQTTLIMTFAASELVLFYILFETTLIPTLIIITRWGNQAERLSAGLYFLFYTLTSSLPLLIALLYFSNKFFHTSMELLFMTQPELLPTDTSPLLWLACLLAFLVKLPLYGLHLWLPKAHVEAPIAGSMGLAAILLKLGGYGLIDSSPMLNPHPPNLMFPIMILALWGILMTSSICLRQTDLKALIAYSSVSHMGLVTAAIIVQTPWGLTGAMTLMIAHGLTSSALFALANTNYERTHTRTLLLVRGLQLIFPLMSTWWLLTNLTNMAMPPTINLLGELFIISTLFNWSSPTIVITGIGTLITATYSLYMFLMTQRGSISTQFRLLSPTHTREHLILILHLLPLGLLIMKPALISGLFT
uniref:NADH-ubiquinone oxidoreductase chain 4 n=1 Tax=Podarcis siculus TaxID=65484 RepID=A0A5P8PAH2_PODSI|nr:NADH dehydrogenase subunit 4 [Podarcis siculus]QFR52725.1 NADH dehydrogenase subunit 4 [Podarcis siculus]QFR52751.1 NADH dehydrogenase subunit 4 [Podarcis siculus]QFR52764.1 NADH dehydrogenase subunit 4 [Podarcis siculus]